MQLLKRVQKLYRRVKKLALKLCSEQHPQGFCEVYGIVASFEMGWIISREHIITYIPKDGYGSLGWVACMHAPAAINHPPLETSTWKIKFLLKAWTKVFGESTAAHN